MATQKYGIAEVITNTGGTTLSSFPPRRQAETMPRPVPRMKARIVVMPTRPSVHQIALPMTDVTDAGYSLERGAEVAGQDLVQVAEVLPEQALVRVDPEEDLQGVQRLRAELAVELRHHGQRGVPRHQPRQQEVEGKRRPQREDEETEAAQYVSQARWLLVEEVFPGPRARDFPGSLARGALTYFGRRRSAYLKLVRLRAEGWGGGRGVFLGSACQGLLPESPGTRRLNLLRRQMQQHLLVVGVGVRGRLGVRVAGRGPAAE